MIDTYMMTYILRGCKKGMRIVIIGDIHQLPSVGAGQVLSDIIGSDKINVVTLTKIFRQASKSNIIINAHRVNEGKEIKILEDEESYNDLDLIYIESQDMMFSKLFEILKKELTNFDATDFFLNSQILTITKKGKCGTVSLNEEIQNIFNPLENEKKKIRYGKVEYRVNDRIMQIKNDYDIVWQMGEYIGSRNFQW